MSKRTIEFRGKRVDNGEWIYGHYYSMECEVEGGDFCRDEILHFILPEEANELQDGITVIPDTVGQFTGIRDKHKNRIWEHMYCKATERGKSPRVYCGRIVMEDGMWGIKTETKTWSLSAMFKCHDLEFSDNPELLNK